jgi:hypothetical protein
MTANPIDAASELAQLRAELAAMHAEMRSPIRLSPRPAPAGEAGASMTAPPTDSASELADLLRKVVDGVEGLRTDLRALGARRREEARVPKLLISYREAARRLGVSRSRTLGALIASGALTPVEVAGQKRLSADEVAQLARGGIIAATSPKVRRRMPVRLPPAMPAAQWKLKV